MYESVRISIASDYSTIPMTIHAALFLPPSFGRRCPEGAEVGRVKQYSHIRESQPRLASLVCPFQRKGREIVVIRGQGLALSPHICRALLRFPPLSFIPPVPYPPLRGTFPSRGRLTIRGKPAIANLRASPIYIRGEAATFIPNSSFLIRAKFSFRISGRSRPTGCPSKEGASPWIIHSTSPVWASLSAGGRFFPIPASRREATDFT